MRIIDIDRDTYLTTHDDEQWSLYRFGILCAYFRATEEQARQRANAPETWADRREIDDAHRASAARLRRSY